MRIENKYLCQNRAEYVQNRGKRSNVWGRNTITWTRLHRGWIKLATWEAEICSNLAYLEFHYQRRLSWIHQKWKIRLRLVTDFNDQVITQCKCSQGLSGFGSAHNSLIFAAPPPPSPPHQCLRASIQLLYARWIRNPPYRDRSQDLVCVQSQLTQSKIT